MTATPALIAAAAGVGFGHAVLPDHWVPLAGVGRARRYPLSRVARLSGLAGIAHVHPRDHSHAGDRAGRLRGSLAIMVPFGAAASPDLTILPVFLAAAAVGTGTAIGSLLAFALVTIATIVGLTLLATLGGYRVRGKWLDRWGNAITAVVLVTIGVLVLTGTI